MKAVLKPLKGKYYGTVVEVTNTDGDSTSVLFWFGVGEPSTREVDIAICSAGDEWKEYINYSHYESATSLQLAKIFVDAVNRYEPCQ